MEINIKKHKKEIKPYRYEMNEQAFVSNINSVLLHENEVLTSEANVLVQKFDSGLVIQYWYYLDGYCECLINKPYRILKVLEEDQEITYLRIENTKVTYKMPEPFGRVTRFVINGEAQPGYEEVTNICK